MLCSAKLSIFRVFEDFCHNFAIICFYPALLIFNSVSFVKIVQVVSVLGAIEVFNVFAIHPDDHVGITMPHDPCDPERIFATAQGIGCETVPSLFHFPVVKTSFFKGGFPYALPQMAGIDHGSGWRTEKEFPLNIVVYLFLLLQGPSHNRDHADCSTAVPVFCSADHDFSIFIAGDCPLDMEQILSPADIIRSEC